jgi:ABC-type multidrug transport system fused ATPase/permease subunit
MTGGQAGFIIGFAQSITNEIGWIVRNLRDFDLDGVTLERLAEYRDLDTEDIAPLNRGKDLGPKPEYADQDLSQWPSDGAIRVSGLGARYAPDMPEILHGVSFNCQGGERVGIEGATGGGKSTLAKAFFSFVDITTGSIEIDGKGEFPVSYSY